MWWQYSEVDGFEDLPNEPCPQRSRRLTHLLRYGAGDSYGSGNCNTNTVACGFFSPTILQAAASQNLFGVGPGAGAGPACGTCWSLAPETDSNGNPLVGAQTTIVQVNNLCPIAGNPLCSQTSLGKTNSLGVYIPVTYRSADASVRHD